MSVRRTVLAFLLAPFWPPAIVLAAIFIRSVWQGHPLLVFIDLPIVLLAAIFAYAGTALFGVPTYLLLRRCGSTSFWLAPVFGFLIAAIALHVGNLVFQAAFWGYAPTIQDLLRPFTDRGAAAGSPIVSVVGALIGATLWFIARPDRQRASR
jgi:hypothetical protein